MILFAIAIGAIMIGSLLETLPAEFGLGIMVALFGAVFAWFRKTAP